MFDYLGPAMLMLGLFLASASPAVALAWSSRRVLFVGGVLTVLLIIVGIALILRRHPLAIQPATKEEGESRET